MTTDQSPEPGSDELLSVLIADDEAVVRETISIYVNSAPDMQVVGTAADGRAAVQMAETLRPDIILMDIQMPHVTGYELIGELHLVDLGLEKHLPASSVVQRLEDEGRPVMELAPQAGVVKLVADRRSDTGGRGERRGRKGRTVLGDPKERGPQSSCGDEFVDRVGREQVGEVADTTAEQGAPAPVVIGERRAGNVDEA